MSACLCVTFLCCSCLLVSLWGEMRSRGGALDFEIRFVGMRGDRCTRCLQCSSKGKCEKVAGSFRPAGPKTLEGIDHDAGVESWG